MLISSPLSGMVYLAFPFVSFVTLLHFFPSNWQPYSPANPACFWGEVGISDLQWLMKLLKLCQLLCEFDVFLVILRIALAFLRIAFFIRIFSWNFLQHSNFSYKVIKNMIAEAKEKKHHLLQQFFGNLFTEVSNKSLYLLHHTFWQSWAVPSGMPYISYR